MLETIHSLLKQLAHAPIFPGLQMPPFVPVCTGSGKCRFTNNFCHDEKQNGGRRIYMGQNNIYGLASTFFKGQIFNKNHKTGVFRIWILIDITYNIIIQCKRENLKSLEDKKFIARKFKKLGAKKFKTA